MKKYILFSIVISLLLIIFTGCSGEDIKDIDQEVIETFEVTNAEETEVSEELLPEETADTEVALIDDKFELIDFYLISGKYTRNVMQDNTEVMEMFAMDKNSFLRIVTHDIEKEVYAYNYSSDDFTYLYYFDGELLAKTVINVETGAVLEDEEGYASLLSTDAEELKTYFYSLIESAGIEVSELNG